MIKRCPECGARLGRGYKYCPICGIELHKEEDFFSSHFGDISEDIERHLRTFDDEQLSEDFFKPRRSGGISISIRSTGNKEPDVKVKTFGDYKKVEPEVKKKLGIKETTTSAAVPKHLKSEEPTANIKRIPEGYVYEIELPGVSSPKNVYVTKLQNSIEIKAIGADKAFFKLIPTNLNMVNYTFENGKLVLRLKK